MEKLSSAVVINKAVLNIYYYFGLHYSRLQLVTCVLNLCEKRTRYSGTVNDKYYEIYTSLVHKLWKNRSFSFYYIPMSVACIFCQIYYELL